MILQVGLFLGGLVLLVTGGHALVSGSAALARRRSFTTFATFTPARVA